MAEDNSNVLTFQPLAPVNRIRRLILDDIGTDYQDLAPRVRGQSYWWGWIVEGPLCNVITARLAEPSWFASGLERTKRGFVVRSRAFTIDGSQISTSRTKTNRVRIEVRRTEVEQDQHKELNAEREAAERAQLDKAASDGFWAEHRAKCLAEEAAQSIEEWRESKIGTIEAFPITNLLDGFGHKRVCDRDRHKVAELCAQIIAVVRNSEVIVQGEHTRPRLTVVK
jgi:hypothetical protein